MRLTQVTTLEECAIQSKATTLTNLRLSETIIYFKNK